MQIGTSTTTPRPPGRVPRDIGPWGTAIRLLLGAASLGGAAWLGIGWRNALVGLVIIPAVLTVALGARVVVKGRSVAPLSPVGATSPLLMALVILGFVAVGFLGFVLGMLLFFGVTTVLAGVLGYRDCEVTAIPNALLRRRDKIVCGLFSPIDDLESASKSEADRGQSA